MRIAVIGTGISGLNVAVQLKRAGIPFVVIEKNPEVGGSWYENRYPGARVDTSSRGYTHLFSYYYPFPWSYSPRDENLKYFKWVADHFYVRKNIDFDTEVEWRLRPQAESTMDEHRHRGHPLVLLTSSSCFENGLPPPPWLSGLAARKSAIRSRIPSTWPISPSTTIR